MSQQESYNIDNPDPLPQTAHLSLVAPYNETASSGENQLKATRISRIFSKIWADDYPNWEISKYARFYFTFSHFNKPIVNYETYCTKNCQITG